MNLLLAIMVSMIPQFAMIVRSSVLTIKGSGLLKRRSAAVHPQPELLCATLFPMPWDTIIVQATLALGGVILTAASMSFIGLGVQPPEPVGSHSYRGTGIYA